MRFDQRRPHGFKIWTHNRWGAEMIRNIDNYFAIGPKTEMAESVITESGR